jgi:hypothetical protein
VILVFNYVSDEELIRNKSWVALEPSATPHWYFLPLTTLPSGVGTAEVLPMTENGEAAFGGMDEQLVE